MDAIVKCITGAILLAIILGMNGCGADNKPPSTAEVIGTYMGRYGGGVETFEIKADGRFDQTFQRGSNIVYAVSGKWNLSEGLVHFEPFMSPDAILSGTPDGKPDSWPRSFGIWQRDPIRIELGEWPYNAVKVKGEGATRKPFDQE